MSIFDHDNFAHNKQFFDITLQPKQQTTSMAAASPVYLNNSAGGDAATVTQQGEERVSTCVIAASPIRFKIGLKI